LGRVSGRRFCRQTNTNPGLAKGPTEAERVLSGGAIVNASAAPSAVDLGGSGPANLFGVAQARRVGVSTSRRAGPPSLEKIGQPLAPTLDSGVRPRRIDQDGARFDANLGGDERLLLTDRVRREHRDEPQLAEHGLELARESARVGPLVRLETTRHVRL